MTNMVDNSLTIGSGGNETCCLTVIPKNYLEEVRVSLTTYKGARFLDLRIYADIGNGERKPTEKGITLAVRQIDSVVAALEQVKAEAGRLGLLDDGPDAAQDGGAE